MRLRGWVGIALVCAAVGPGPAAAAHTPHRKDRRHVKRPAGGSGPTAPAPANLHFAEDASIALPGRGLALAWSPDATRLAVGGRFRDRATGLRYDTRIADAATATLAKSFACHYFFVIATAWTANPFLGEIVADGGGDHAVKLWDAEGAGSATCRAGQFLAGDGARRALTQINGWTTALAFSPDGRFLAGASRDRTVRVWQLAPGPGQFQVVTAIHDPAAENFASVAWRRDGRGVVTGDRRGRVIAWALDPDATRWDDATIAEFAGVSYEAQAAWFAAHPTLAAVPADRHRERGRLGAGRPRARLRRRRTARVARAPRRHERARSDAPAVVAPLTAVDTRRKGS